MTTEYKIGMFKIGEDPVLDYFKTDNEELKKYIVDRDYSNIVEGLKNILKKSGLNNLEAKINLKWQLKMGFF